MNYLSVVEVAKKWGISERSVRNYCAQGRVQGAFLTGKTWNIPDDADKPARMPKKITKQVRLIMFKECLKYNIVPFIIAEELKLYYYRGLKEWKNERGYLKDTCLMAQDQFKLILDYFKISYED